MKDIAERVRERCPLIDAIYRMTPDKGGTAVFGRSESLALKGIAIILMLFHHNFRTEGIIRKYQVLCSPFAEQQVVNLAVSFKICVSIFAFVSGYGLYLDRRKNRQGAAVWAAQRYVRSFSGYWFVCLACAAVCQLLDGRTGRVFFSDGIGKGVMYCVIDFLGLAKLFGSPTLCGAWWYMSAAAVFILLLPLLFRFRDNLVLIAAAVIALPRVLFAANPEMAYTGGNSVYAFLLPFLLGCIFARYRLFDLWKRTGRRNGAQTAVKIAAELVLIAAAYKMYHRIPVESFWEFHNAFYPMLVILFIVEFILPFAAFRGTMAFPGRYSRDIFLIHIFIRGYYLDEFTYSFRHFLLITAVLLFISLLVSVILDLLKKLLHYGSAVDRLEKAVERRAVKLTDT